MCCHGAMDSSRLCSFGAATLISPAPSRLFWQPYDAYQPPNESQSPPSSTTHLQSRWVQSKYFIFADHGLALASDRRVLRSPTALAVAESRVLVLNLHGLHHAGCVFHLVTRSSLLPALRSARAHT